MKYDIWLIDSITSLITIIEEDLERDEAVEWWDEWNERHHDCICVMAPGDIKMPELIHAVSKRE
ncbi:MAG: hypothetical protein SGI77_25005 [Pirellulaceae bacterium]|nr:hypothetical protein [Pirellulaceae bacterium]